MATTPEIKSESRRPTRRTRIVCISDTHNCTVKLPPGDVLIHAGDLTNQGSYSKLSRAVRWLEGLRYEAKIIIAGNHDITLDADFYAKHGHEFHNNKMESHEECLALLTRSPSLTYLHHETATIRLSSPAGPRTEFTVFGSPLAPAFGHWAFYYDPPPYGHHDHSKVSPWEAIPAHADIVVTHTPPRGHCDDRGVVDRPAGCEALRRALWRVRPRLAVCGHLHEGRGVSRVLWDLGRVYGERDGNDGDDGEAAAAAAAAAAVAAWQDPGEEGPSGNKNNKMSLVDLSASKKSNPRPLDNDGGLGRHDGDYGTAEAAAAEAAAPGWHGRRETCVVNAAVLKSKFPHAGGKQFYKPIVVDLDLPVVVEESRQG